MSKSRLKRVPLAPADTAWWRMEHPTNLMMINGVFMFHEPLSLDDLREVVSSRLLRFERFRQRIIQPSLPLQPPYWETDPHFDLDSHLHRIALPAPGDTAALQELVNDFMSTPLDYTKPLWHLHLVEGYGSGSALICRLHHCIADGIALVRVLLSLTDSSPAGQAAQPPVDDAADGQEGSIGFFGLGNALRTTTRLAGSIVQESLDAISDPSRLMRVVRQGAEGTSALAHLLLLSPDPETPLKGSLGIRKRCAWTEDISLEDVKAVRRVTGSTVNDVLLTAVSGALGRYLRQRGHPTDGLNFRAVVPVNLRPVEEELRLGNAFGLVFLALPVGIIDPYERLLELKRRMDEIKGTPEAIVAYGILNAIGLATPEIEDAVVSLFEKKATTVMTNVPGPAQTLYLAGQPISGLMFWVPQSGRLGLGVSLLSYAGQVMVGVATDAGLVPDPETIVEAFRAEFDDMMQLVRQAEEADQEARERPKGREVLRCLGKTRSGDRCRRPPSTDSEFCHWHQPAR